jgi:hypothetical protein
VAKPETVAKTVPLLKFGMRDLWRTALWGISAAGALALVVYAGTTDLGRDRLHVAMTEVHELLIPSGAALRPLDAREGRRLAETVHALATDRDRLLARIATLEQSIDGITGSIARVEKAGKAAPMPEPPAEPPQTTPSSGPEEGVTSSIRPPAEIPHQQEANPIPMPPQPPGSTVARTEFGLDLGSASTVEALRTAWTAALRRHGTLLEGLRPVVQTRERPRPGSMELRLIAGPIPNAGTAARLCAAMTSAGAICAPAVFEGQRLALQKLGTRKQLEPNFQSE